LVRSAAPHRPPRPRLFTLLRYRRKAAIFPCDALREALSKLKGRLQVGVLNSIGQRKDAKAAPALARLLYDADPEVAQAAAAALGNISGAQAAKALTDGLRKTKAPVRTAVAGAVIAAETSLTRPG
jgi:HEAT repeat protein